MKRIVVLTIASGIASVSASLAQDVPSGPAKVVEAAPKDGELSVMLDLHASPPRRASNREPRRRHDLMRLKND